MAERDAAAQSLDQLRRRLSEDLGTAYAQHAQISRQLLLHAQVLVPQSKLAFDSTLVAYQSGTATFDAVLTTETEWLRLEVDYYDFLGIHIKSITDFEALQRGARSGASGGMNATAASPAPATRPSKAMGSMR